MTEPAPATPEAEPPRLDKILRKTLSSDPRMPIRLDRAAWRRPTSESEDETQELVALRDQPPAQELGDVVEAAMRAMEARSAPRLRRYRVRSEQPPAAPAPAPQTAPAATATAAVAAPPSPSLPAGDVPTGLAPPSGWRARAVTLLVRVPWSKLWVGGSLLVALAFGCHQLARSDAAEALRATLLVLDRPTVLSDAQLSVCEAALSRYRELVPAGDPDLSRWQLALQR